MNRIAAAGVFLLAILIFSLYGVRGELTRDQAIYMYGGQQLVKGVPPYVSIFDHKGPLAFMLPVPGIVLARSVGLDDLRVTRIFFLLIGALTVWAVYRLGETLLGFRAGLFAAITFMGFFNFARHAASGPHPKTAMVLFQTLALLCLVKRRWWWSGFTAALAAMTWQPMFVFVLAAVALAAFQPASLRRRALTAVSLGAAVPISLVVVYFVLSGAVRPLLEGAVLFNLRYLDRGPYSLPLHLINVAGDVLAGYRTAILAIVVGLMMLPVMWLWRRTSTESWRQMLIHDPFAVLFLTIPFPIAWSLVDFQGPPDLYVFLPYAAIGFGWFLALAAEQVVGVLSQAEGRRTALRFVLTSALAFSLAGMAAVTVLAGRESGLGPQRRTAAEIVKRFGPDGKYVSIGAPEFLVLTRRSNSNRYVFLVNGIDRQIAAERTDGLESWLQELEEFDPDVVAFGLTRGQYRDRIMWWLTSRYTEIVIGPWRFFVRPDASIPPGG